MPGRDDFWVFGYGSLMWDPGFAFADRRPGVVHGYHRAFCIISHRYRGTPECPGLVLGLAPGGSCRGVAYRVAGALHDEVMAYLRDRELMHYVYHERAVPVRLDDGRRISAVTYVADAHHERYAGGLPRDELVRLILQGRGERGACTDYLANTVRHLDELGIADNALHALHRAVETARGGGR